MIENIINILKDLSVKNYIIKKTYTKTLELFFIKKNLDMRRMKKATLYSVTVFHDFTDNDQKMRGASIAYISPDMNNEEILRSVSNAYEAAANVKNPFFTLCQGKKEPTVEMKSGFTSLSMREAAAQMAAALFKADTRNDSFLNSAELFITCNQVHILTSEGTDVGYKKYSCSGEFVVQCKEPQDVEQYFHFAYDDLNTSALTAKVAEALNIVCDRAKAYESPKAGTYDVVLTGEHIRTIMDFYLSRAGAPTVYAKYSDYKPGINVQGENVVGEKINMTLLVDTPYSSEGIPVKERKMIDNGKLLTLHGSTRFCRYLNIEPTGEYSHILVDNGTVPFEEMKKGCLYPISFSDFQCDDMSGYFGGEIRLAYLYTDDGVQILTGGSINGNFLEKQNDMVFSCERYNDATYTGPMAVKFKNINVSGK